MGLSKSLSEKKYDIRLLEWNLNNNIITKEEYDKYLSELADCSGNADTIKLVDEEDMSATPATNEMNSAATDPSYN